MIQSFPGGRHRPGLTRGWFVAFLVLAIVCTACSLTDQVASPTPCLDDTYPAVRLEVVNEDNAPLIGASLRYREEDGSWQEWPENTGRNTIIRGGPGLYQLEIGKEGYGGVLTQVNVPASVEDACRPIVQTARLQLAQTPCPNPPEDMVLTIEPPLSRLQASISPPASGRQQLACRESDGDTCRSFSFPVDKLGDYDLKLGGLPGMGPMLNAGNVITYDPPAVALQLKHRGLAETADATGAESVELTFPVRLDEANCPLADLRDVELNLKEEEAVEETTPVPDRPALALSYLGNLTITDLGAEGCQVEPVLKTLFFGAELPAGTDLADIQVQVAYGVGWKTATCEFGDGDYICQVAAPNPLLNHPFVARVLAGEEEAIGMSLPFNNLCLIFD